MSSFVIFLIRIYQKFFSPDAGVVSVFFPYPVCRHFPTCSEYTIQMVRGYGVLRGLSLGLFRIVKCNPWSLGGGR